MGVSLLKGIALVIACIITSTAFMNSASAISNTAPDPDEYGSAGGHTRLALSNIASTQDITHIILPIYVLAASGTDPSSIRAQIDLTNFYYPYDDSAARGNYRVWADNSSDAYGGICTAPAGGNSASLTIGGFQRDNDTGLFFTLLDLKLVNRVTGGSDACHRSNGNLAGYASQSANALFEFKATLDWYRIGSGANINVNSSTNNGWIAYTAANSGYFSTDARARGSGFADYKLQLATPCYITSATSGTIRLYDLDHNNADNNGGNIDISIKDSAGNNVSYTHTGSRGNNGVYRITMTFQPNERYTLHIDNIYYWNILQYTFPFNNISYVTDCPSQFYELTPDVDVSAGVVGVGNTVTFRPSVTNSTFHSNNTNWVVRRIIIPPAGSVPYTGVRTTGVFNCGYYVSQGMGCTDVGSGSRTFTTTSPTQVPSALGYSYVAPTLPFGTRICYALDINSRNTSANQHAEAIECSTITKTPRLQVWGNDVRVGSGFVPTGTVTTSLINTNTGSWGEYGVLAPSSVTNFGSGASSASVALTFANTPTPGSFTAQPSDLGVLPGVEAYLSKAGNAEYRDKTGIIIDDRGSANITIDGNDSYKANTVYITDGSVTINHNIINSSNGANLSQMVIIAGDISISPAVTQVDAWLVATNTVNTCSAPGNPTVANCGVPLTINGPTMAKQLLLRRTGGDDATNAPAETFNLRGDAYIWVRKLSGLTGTVRTVYTRELAPRY